MPSQESELAVANPGNVIASTYYVRTWERDAGAEADALREELRSLKAELELTETKVAAAGALAEKAREAYERGREDMRCAVRRASPLPAPRPSQDCRRAAGR
ncbi:Os08g0463300 [Oryza sativa Japonica Group]|uniref:Os08g0463300 protein n=1 Tax=Oryza sativa subsp. japonica TaxID=39947 RepID=A0A0P0XGQ1_ORYSJ|nr:Os08g0463300 [Oryza sativa Japonica Group]